MFLDNHWDIMLRINANMRHCWNCRRNMILANISLHTSSRSNWDKAHFTIFVCILTAIIAKINQYLICHQHKRRLYNNYCCLWLTPSNSPPLRLPHAHTTTSILTSNHISTHRLPLHLYTLLSIFPHVLLHNSILFWISWMIYVFDHCRVFAVLYLAYPAYILILHMAL